MFINNINKSLMGNTTSISKLEDKQEITNISQMSFAARMTDSQLHGAHYDSHLEDKNPSRNLKLIPAE